MQGYQLKASIAFPALALFNLLRDPIRQLPDCITSFINARIAARRLQDFLHVRVSTLHVISRFCLPCPLSGCAPTLNAQPACRDLLSHGVCACFLL